MCIIDPEISSAQRPTQNPQHPTRNAKPTTLDPSPKLMRWTAFLLLLAVVWTGCIEFERADEAAPSDTTAAQAPGTDIYLAALTVDDGQVQIGEPTNVTRRPGYDNQPAFLTDGSGFLYTSVRNGQADTYQYVLAADTSTRVTDTPESEYSPTPVEDGFSTIMVEFDGTQRLWQYDMDGSDPEVLFPNIQPVGYHTWASEQLVALYVLGDPPTLQLGNARTQLVVDTLATDIGRSMHNIPGRPAISYVQYTSDSTSIIRALQGATRTATDLVETIDGGDFHAWTPGGILLMARGSTLYQWTDGADGWQPVADLAPLQDITRLAVSLNGTRLALVAAEPTEESP